MPDLLTRLEEPIPAAPHVQPVVPSSPFSPVAPVGGAPSDAAALALAWTTPDAGSRHRVQVARDAAFAALVADVESPGDALVLHGVLPEDEATYYWRVGDGGVWSAPAAFRASTDDAVLAHRDTLAAEARAAAKEAAKMRSSQEAQEAEAHAPWRTGTTSRVEVLALLYVLFVTFAMTLALVFRVVL